MLFSLILYVFVENAALLFVLGDKNTHPDLEFDEKGLLKIFIDGRSTNAGRPYAKAGYGVWFNFNNTLNLSSPVTGIATAHNAEIQAAIKAIQLASSVGIKKIKIHTDSMFLLNVMTDWIHKWKQGGWISTKKKPIKNLGKLVELDNAAQTMEKIEWTYLRRDEKVPGNEEVITLSRAGMALYEVQNATTTN